MNETETFTLPVSGKEVIVRGYVTGYIDREVQRLLAGANKMHFEVDASVIDDTKLDGANFPPGTKAVLDQDPTAKIDADAKLLELMVSSLDGSTGDVFNRLMQLPAKDVDFVTAKINEVKTASEVVGADPKALTS